MNYNYQQTIHTFHTLASQWQEKFMYLDLYTDTYAAFCARCKNPDAAVFEIGCGPGNITQHILRECPGFRILGIDAAPAMVELARQNVPAAQFEVMDARNISTINNVFDAVICGFCLPYLAKEDAEKLISDTAALLQPQGIFYLSTIEDDYSKSALQTSSNGQHSAYQFFYRESDLQKMLTENGFTILQSFRKVLEKSDGTTETGIIFIAEKN
jgi:2-polyprenyl-3-methyl-5-hydroxy-6-metoxy-1,4-benzoquinol methylase